jgi:hypothetical protein
MMNPAWPERIDCGRAGRISEMAIKRASQKAKSGSVFGQVRKPAKMFRAGPCPRVSIDDQQTIPLQIHALREYAAQLRGTIALQVRKVGSRSQQQHFRFKDDASLTGNHASRPISVSCFDRRSFLGICLKSAAGMRLAAQQPASPSARQLSQFQFESKLWPNLHHFLYILARARNGAPDSARVAVRQAPKDIEGFDGLPASQRKAWDEAVTAYQTHAATLDIGYGSLVDVNYAVADLAVAQPIEEAKEIPGPIRDALAKAGPVYRTLWWPRHDASNRAWIRQLTPRVEQYGPRIVDRLTATFHHSWPTLPLRVEAVAYANPQGAYTTEDPPLIAMSSLSEQHTGVDGLEQLFHECSHLMTGTVDAGLTLRTRAAGKNLSRDVSHAILFYTVAETFRGLIPEHVPYPDHYGVWNRGLTHYHDLLKLYWQPYLDGKVTMDEALDHLVQEI